MDSEQQVTITHQLRQIARRDARKREKDAEGVRLAAVRDAAVKQVAELEQAIRGTNA
jgi:hypothetical protein